MLDENTKCILNISLTFCCTRNLFTPVSFSQLGLLFSSFGTQSLINIPMFFFQFSESSVMLSMSEMLHRHIARCPPPHENRVSKGETQGCTAAKLVTSTAEWSFGLRVIISKIMRYIKFGVFISLGRVILGVRYCSSLRFPIKGPLQNNPVWVQVRFFD